MQQDLIALIAIAGVTALVIGFIVALIVRRPKPVELPEEPEDRQPLTKAPEAPPEKAAVIEAPPVTDAPPVIEAPAVPGVIPEQLVEEQLAESQMLEEQVAEVEAEPQVEEEPAPDSMFIVDETGRVVGAPVAQVEEAPVFEAAPQPVDVPEPDLIVLDEVAEADVAEVEALEEEAVEVEPEPDTISIVEVPPAPMAPAEEAVEPAGRFARALQKTRGFLAERIAVITRRDRIDEDAWDEVEEALIRADVGVKATTRVIDDLRSRSVTPGSLSADLRTELAAVLRKGDSQLRIFEDRPSVWLVTGVNGVGKTTSIAKMAHRLRQEGHTVVIAAADTFRAAAIDQLATWADRAGVHMVKHEPGADPGAVVFDAIAHAKARNIEVVLVVTAGRLHTKSNLMDELKKVRRVAEREAGEIAEVLLVLDATVGQNGIAQARTFQEAIEVSGVILTKLDGSARGGIVVAIQEELDIPVKAVGIGEGIEDIEPFEVDRFVEALIG